MDPDKPQGAPYPDHYSVSLRKRSPEERYAYIANAERSGLIDPDIAAGMIAAARRADREDLEAYMSRPIGPATSADLAELDAVPEPVDSDAPAETHAPGCAPIGPTAKTRPYRVPAIEADVHARTLARARP